jgi:hypothetical protein
MGTLTDADLLHLLGEAAGSFQVPEDGAELVLEEIEDEAAVVPLHRRRLVQLPAAAAVVAVAVLGGLALFGGNDVDRVGQLAGAERPSVVTDGQADGAAQAGPEGRLLSSGGSGGGGGEALGQDALQDLRFSSTDSTARAVGSGQAPAPVPAADAGKAAPPAAAPVPDGARVVKTGAIALIVEDDEVTPTLTEVQNLAAAVGGEVATAKTQESGPTPSGSVTLRIPVDRFEEVVEQVRSLDAEVRSATTSGQDVTAQYADLEAQLRTLTAARERFLEILSRARTIGDVLAVQQRVDEVTGTIDRLEGQRRVLAAQSDSATLEVTVTEADDPVVRADKPDDGLSKAFSDAWTGFTTGVEGLIRLSGRGLLLALCVALAYVVLRLGWRASRRRLV